MKKRAVILFIICLVILIGALIANKIFGESYLKLITCDEIIEKIENKENFVLMLSQTTCHNCDNFKPKLEKFAKNNKLLVYYIEVNKLNDEEKKALNLKVSFDSTPTTVFIKNGYEKTAASRIVGDVNMETIIRKFKSNGYDVE